MHKVHRVLDSLLQCVLRRVRLRRPIFHRNLQRRKPLRVVQQRMHACRKFPLPRFFLGGQYAELLSKRHRSFPPGKILLRRRKRIVCRLHAGQKAHKAPRQRLFLPEGIQLPRDGVQQKFRRRQTRVKAHSPQLRRGGCLLPRQNFRKVEPIPAGRKEPEKRREADRDLLVLQKFPEQRVLYLEAQPLIACEHLR